MSVGNSALVLDIQNWFCSKRRIPDQQYISYYMSEKSQWQFRVLQYTEIQQRRTAELVATVHVAKCGGLHEAIAYDYGIVPAAVLATEHDSSQMREPTEKKAKPLFN